MSRIPLVALTLSLAALLAPGPARADTTAYTFIGLCSDCARTASASLVLRDYKLGDQIGDLNFVSFSYDGTDLFAPYTITAADAPALSGSIVSASPTAENVSISDQAVGFVSMTSGSWCTGVGFACSSDYGTSHLWSAAPISVTVPEPMTLGLLGTGLLGLAAIRRRA